ncbi:MAG: helix-turn-helix domain-containing protein [Spirochaetales bacterium]|nr:helix-turn-helix domain-containing protein [Spirochaetales bacterium]
MKRKLTQAELAEAVGTSTGYISDIERSMRWPSARILTALATALGKTPSLLLLSSDEKERFSYHQGMEHLREKTEMELSRLVREHFDQVQYGREEKLR